MSKPNQLDTDKFASVVDWYSPPKLDRSRNANGSTSYRIVIGKDANGKRVKINTGTNAGAAQQALQNVARLVESKRSINYQEVADSADFHEIQSCIQKLRRVGATIADATNFFLNHRRPNSALLTIKEAMNIYQKRVEASGNRLKSKKNAHYASAKLAEKCGSKLLINFNVFDCEDFLHQSNTWSDRTKNDYRNWLRTVFNDLANAGYYSRELNPWSKIKKIKVNGLNIHENSIFSISDARTWLDWLYEEENYFVLFHQILVMFLGFRSEEALHMTFNNLREKDTRIHLSSNVDKNWRIRDNELIGVSKPWIDEIIARTKRKWPNQWKLGVDGGLDQKIKKTKKKFKKEYKNSTGREFEFSKNIARNSFISYGSHFIGDEKTSKYAGHVKTTGETANRFYKTLCTKKEADEYFEQILPSPMVKNMIQDPKFWRSMIESSKQKINSNDYAEELKNKMAKSWGRTIAEHKENNSNNF